MAVVAALLALFVVLPQRFPAWELNELRDYLTAEPRITTLRMLDTGIVMTQKLKHVVQRKATLLRWSVLTLAAAVVLTTGGSLAG